MATIECRSVLAGPDVQAGRPATEVSLTRFGVRGVEKVIRVCGNGEPEVTSDGDRRAGDLYFAELECFVDLHPRQAGVHMSRFEEVINEAIDEVVLGEAFKAEVLAAHIAAQVRERQEGMRAEVTVFDACAVSANRSNPSAARPARVAAPQAACRAKIRS